MFDYYIQNIHPFFMKKIFLLSLLFSFSLSLSAQRKGYWQQHVDYNMYIDVDERHYQYTGKMDLKYTNHSGSDLNKVYFHLYFNAFQPGSAMDHRLSSIEDPDRRMMTDTLIEGQNKRVSRISLLTDDQIGYQKVSSILMNGQPASFDVSGTIMSVTLPQPIADGQTAHFTMEWTAQVPEQIRRSGRNSKEGIALSMTQWYPKMAHYDEFGWHLDEYIAREFVAPFGDFDVKINIHEDYIIGGSGVLQNPDQVKGYQQDANIRAHQGKVEWHFKAKNIHDFAWAADPKFVVDSAKTSSGVTLYTLYDPQSTENIKKWTDALHYTVPFFDFCSEHFGEYPWPTYTIAQGGDGGMEYGTATLVTGDRSLRSLVNVIFHEAAHSWYQQLFGINETVDDWFDEGFTSWIEDMGMQLIFDKKESLDPNPAIDAYNAYIKLALSGKEEPASLLADYYNSNYAYSHEAYNKGQVFAVQLGYIIGVENLKQTFKRFYELWKFKHPTPNDFKRVAEDVSGINLKWYLNLFQNTTRKIDYSISQKSSQHFIVQNESDFAMPLDILVEYTDGTQELLYIPLLEMRGQKEAEDLALYKGIPRRVLDDWFWTKPTYDLHFDKEVQSIEIDPSLRLADVDKTNNRWIR